MTNHRINPTRALATAGLSALVLMFPGGRLAAANPGENPGATAGKGRYEHAPVTFWLVPNVGTGGLLSHDVKTNVALSLGASGYARLEGADLGVAASWVTESVRGVQMTTGLNYAGVDVIGAQITTGANLSAGTVIGAQISSGYNQSPIVQGAQIGLVNYGAQIAGAQVGLVNVGGEVFGTQLGLVNVAEHSDAPLGLVNVISDGQKRIGFWASDAVPLNIGLKLGGRYLYTLFTAGFESSGGTQRWLAGIGLGAHLPIDEALSLDVELITAHVNEGYRLSLKTNSLNSLRVLANYQLADHFGLFAGPALNVLVTEVGDGEGFGLIRGSRVSAEGSDTTVRMWPGLVAGFQI